jgi:hypothetical protein
MEREETMKALKVPNVICETYVSIKPNRGTGTRVGWQNVLDVVFFFAIRCSPVWDKATNKNVGWRLVLRLITIKGRYSLKYERRNSGGLAEAL